MKKHRYDIKYEYLPNPKDKTSFFRVRVNSAKNGKIYEGPILDVYELARQLRKTLRYQKWRAMVLRVKGYKCSKCDCKHSLDVHHKWKLINILKELHIVRLQEAIDCSVLWKLKRGVVLCIGCHSEEHPELYKKYFAARYEKQLQLQNAELILS